MKKNKKQRLAMIVAIILAILMILPVIISAVTSMTADAITQSDINKLKQQQKDLKSKKTQIQGKLNDLKNDKADAVEQKAAIDEQIGVIEEEISNVSEIITQINTAIAERQLALDTAIADEKAMYELFRVRVRVMEEMGETSYLGVLFQSTSFSDLLGRWDLINEIMQSDKDLMLELSHAKEVIQQEQELLTVDRQEQYTFKRDLAGNQAELAEKNAEAEALIAQLLNAVVSAETEYALSEQESKNLESKIDNAEDELKKQIEAAAKAAAAKNKKYVGGQMQWPVPASGNISSPYGMRNHPILKKQKMHTGIDISAAKGSKIVAANSGTVIVATYSSGYGNYLVVDHGGGRTTMYAHQTGFAKGVVNGTDVKQGSTIGYVGSTGLSTGPHLHFEVRNNGSHTNPVPYLTK